MLVLWTKFAVQLPCTYAKFFAFINMGSLISRSLSKRTYIPMRSYLKSAQQQANHFAEGGGDVRSQEGLEAQRILQNLREVVRARGRGLQPHTQASEISCPVCGIYFGSEAGLAMHIKSKHKETHERAKVTYVKPQHSMFGIPMRKFCLRLQCDWHSLEKHITMGGCLEVKTAIAKGITLDQLLEDTDKAHALCPPQPPESIRHQTQQKVLLADNADMYSAQNSDLNKHAPSIRTLGSRCALCGQVLLSGARVKPHWRQSHPEAWSQVSHDAICTSKSLASIFRKPCQFCSSKANNSTAHSGQRSALFQVLAGRCLRNLGLQDEAGLDSKAPKAKSYETEAAYTQFDIKLTPLAKAFKKGAGERQSEASITQRSMSPAMKQLEPDLRQDKTSGIQKPCTGQPTIQQFFRRQHPNPAGEQLSGARLPRPWTFHLRLGNPHSFAT